MLRGGVHEFEHTDHAVGRTVGQEDGRSAAQIDEAVEERRRLFVDGDWDARQIQVAVKGATMQTLLQDSGVFAVETVLEQPALWKVFRSRG